jgi:transposase
MDHIIRIGMDTSKHVFQLHGVNAAEEPVLRRKLRRNDMVVFFERLAPTIIAIEAAGASHHWARLLRSFGHEVKLIAPQLVKPYVKRGKNDAADAEALCEAMSRPTMRFVPVKTAERQAALMLLGLRDRLVRNRTQLANAIRGYAAEGGATTRAQDATVQISSIRAALPQCPCRRPQHVQSSTPPHFPIDTADLPSRSDGRMAGGCRRCINLIADARSPSSTRYRDKASGSYLRCLTAKRMLGQG